MEIKICHECQKELKEDFVTSDDDWFFCHSCSGKINPYNQASTSKTVPSERLKGLSFEPDFFCIDNLTAETFFKGRMGRKNFALNFLLLWFLNWPFIFLYSTMEFSLHYIGLGVIHFLWSIFLIILVFICWGIMFLWWLRIYTLRFHDLDKPGSTILLGLIPFYAIFLLVILFGRKGQEGDNKYGSPCKT